MTGIVDRLDPDHDSEVTGQSSFSGHEVFSFFQLRANGILTEQEVIGGLGLDVDGQTDLTWITGKYTAATNKDKFMSTLHAGMMLYRGRHGTRQKLIDAIEQAM